MRDFSSVLQAPVQWSMRLRDRYEDMMRMNFSVGRERGNGNDETFARNYKEYS